MICKLRRKESKTSEYLKKNNFFDKTKLNINFVGYKVVINNEEQNLFTNI